MSDTPVCPECGTKLSNSGDLCPKCPAATVSHKPSPKPPARTPAVQPVDLPAFRRAVLELGLVSPEDLDRLAEQAAGDPSRLAKLLVSSKRLSPYQAGVLIQGKAKGLVIGPYLVLDKRGQGGMGVVFKAKHRDTGREVALKILLPSFSRDRDALLRFRREFEVAARIAHPNVVAALDASEDRGVQYLTMEFVDGHDLDELVREVGPLPIKMSLHCAIQAANGLAAAHSLGIIHRDVKPANLILGPTGVVRVLDLGLAKVIEAANSLGRGADGSLTQSGAYMGTVDFIAPEQADDSKKADHRADIYALGCTLYFLLTGRPPFEDATVLKRLMSHQQQPAPSLHAARKDIPAALEAAYQTMMAKRPADRPQSMAEVIDVLEGCRTSADEATQASAGLRTFAETVMKRAAPRKRGRDIDASVFARPDKQEGLQFDLDLNLEDVLDFREESKPRSLTEEELPPLLPRIVRPRKRSRDRSQALILAGAVVLLGLCVLAFPLFLRSSVKPDARVDGTTTTTAPVSLKPTGGLTPLFNGKDLSGWKSHPSQPGNWRVAEGVLIGSGSAASHLYTERGDYKDFHLVVETRISDGGHGALCLRSRDRPIWGEKGKTPTWPAGYEVAINSTHGTPERTGSVRVGGQLFWEVRESPSPGQWCTLDLIIIGNQIVVRVDGKTVSDYMDEQRAFASGFIALQAMGGRRPGDPESVVEFRRVEIEEFAPGSAAGAAMVAGESDKDEGFVPLFAGNDLGGWEPQASQLGDWHLENGVLSTKGTGNSKTMLLSKKALDDFMLRCDFQLGGDRADSGILLSGPEGGKYTYLEVQLGGPDPFKDTAGVYWSDDGKKIMFADPAVPPALKRGAPWNQAEVTFRGGLMTVAINGRVVSHFQDMSHLPGPRRIGFQALVGLVRLRNLRLWDGTGKAPSARPGRVLHFDEFANDWRRDEPGSKSPHLGPRQDQAEWKDEPVASSGNEKGVYFFAAENPSDWGLPVPPIGLTPEFRCEAVGRVLPLRPGSEGSWGLQVITSKGALQVRIDGDGRLWIEPSFWTAKSFPDNPPRQGPITHAAIRPGQQFNTLVLLVKRHEVQILVNGARVCEPLQLDWMENPDLVMRAIFCKKGGIRAEYEKIEIRELIGESPTPSPASTRGSS